VSNIYKSFAANFVENISMAYELFRTLEVFELAVRMNGVFGTGHGFTFDFSVLVYITVS